MGYTYSPLRYPGGKSSFSKLLARFIELNNLHDGIYAEPYAGGAGAGLYLLFSEYVNRILLNDADKMIYLFWKSILHDTEKLVKLINDTPITIEEWQRQRLVFNNIESHSELEVAFAVFYLNRCNRSGILNAGPIGGRSQNSEWHIDARYNKEDLIKRVEKVALFSTRIDIFNLDAIDFMEQHLLPLSQENVRLLVYLDPPYYSKGDQLYLNYYSAGDHARLSRFMNDQNGFKWIVSYDDVEEIRHLYHNNTINEVSRYYFANKTKIGKEVIIFSPGCVIPDLFVYNASESSLCEQCKILP